MEYMSRLLCPSAQLHCAFPRHLCNSFKLHFEERLSYHKIQENFQRRCRKMLGIIAESKAEMPICVRGSKIVKSARDVATFA
jgi:hypothetical protein